MGLIGPVDAWSGIAKGIDVYLFLIGMMSLSELARQEGLFDWLASIAITQARGSPKRLFVLIYAVVACDHTLAECIAPGGVKIGAWTFLRVGIVVTIPVLAASLTAIAIQ